MTSSSSPPYLLNDLIDTRFIQGLNTDKSHPIKMALMSSSSHHDDNSRTNGSGNMGSDPSTGNHANEQQSSSSSSPPPSQYVSSNKNDPIMILYLPFKGKVSLSHLLFSTIDNNSTPGKMLFYCNQMPDDVDFENYEDLNVMQVWEGDGFEENENQEPENQSQSILIQLRASKFKAVSSLHIVIESTMASDDSHSSKMANLQLYGKTFGRNESLKKRYIPEKCWHTRYGGYRGDEL